MAFSAPLADFQIPWITLDSPALSVRQRYQQTQIHEIRNNLFISQSSVDLDDGACITPPPLRSRYRNSSLNQKVAAHEPLRTKAAAGAQLGDQHFRQTPVRVVRDPGKARKAEDRLFHNPERFNPIEDASEKIRRVYEQLALRV